MATCHVHGKSAKKKKKMDELSSFFLRFLFFRRMVHEYVSVCLHIHDRVRMYRWWIQFLKNQDKQYWQYFSIFLLCEKVEEILYLFYEQETNKSSRKEFC
jgi:hypothetical protein